VAFTNTLRVVDADPDDMVVESASIGNASYIVTGDKHILEGKLNKDNL
jgi:predicted nucleic acid-binding protein